MNDDHAIVARVLKTLERVFVDYDKVNGKYPESKFEGSAVLTFTHEVLGVDIDEDRIKRENPERYNHV